MALPTWHALFKVLRPLQKTGVHALGLGAMAALAIAPPATSAERIEFFIGPLEPVILVEDLAAFAQDGTINDSFRLVANNMSEEQRQQLRSFLNWHLDAELISVSQFTYWQLGERLLDRAGQVIQTDTLLNGSRPLRAALIAAAADGDGFTPLEVIQEFPLAVMQLDFGRLQQIIQDNRRFFAARQQLIGLLRSIGEREAAALPPPTRNLDPTRPGPYTWQRQVIQFENPLRDGEIPFDLYVPQRGPETGPTPVIVISHGASSGRGAFTYLAQHLASHGYAVVVPEHDDDHQKYEQFLAGADRPPNPITLISRPLDISLALDELEQLAQQGGAYGNLDVNNVGVLGHSLGGFTALTVAGAEFDFETLHRNCSLEDRDRPSLNISLLVQCDLLDVEANGPFQLKDDRIQAVFAMSPPTSLFFGPRGLAHVDRPTLFLAASADIIVPAIPEQVLPYQWLGSRDRYLVMVENATHFTFLQGHLTEGAIPLPSRLLGPNPRPAQPYLKALSVAFFDRHLRDQTSAEGYLTQPYLDSLGTDPFRFAIVRDFRTQ
ncbi:MAG: alpha/beta hydrolase [Cyanobacteria bacterium]|nr:alpha/beta hydrolase [Cyanobacteriota bacterium]MDA0866083.1 alpha/beta hydrolase [Cyanobacteriota bacterium]